MAKPVNIHGTGGGGLTAVLPGDMPSDEVIKEFFGFSDEDVASLDEWAILTEAAANDQ